MPVLPSTFAGPLDLDLLFNWLSIALFVKVRGGGVYVPYASVIPSGGTKWSGLCGRRNLEQDLQGADFLALCAPGTDSDSVVLATQPFRHNITRTVASGASFRIYWQQDQRDILTNISKCAFGGSGIPNSCPSLSFCFQVCVKLPTIFYPRTTSSLDPFCHTSCNSKCWYPNDANACQKICTSACGDAGCFDNNWGQCCSSTCAGGCFSDGRCKGCADGYLLQDDGSCALTCPTGQLQSGLGRTLTCSTRYITYFRPLVCVRDCPSGTFSNGTHCNLYCDGGADPINGVCPSTSGPYKGMHWMVL
jgi:hypothetical protein